MSYRTNLAQKVHTAILKYIDNEKDWIQLEAAINQLDKASLLETSINGHSHLIDILHLTYDRARSGAEEKCSVMMRALFRRAKNIGYDALKILLIQEDQSRFTPLHAVLKSGSAENMRTYFDEVDQSRQDGFLNNTDYCNLLTRANKDGFTPLHEALIARNTENIRAYLDKVRDALKHRIISKSAYRHLLTKPNKEGFTPLHEALKLGNVESVHIYFAEVNYARERAILSKRAYRHLLTKPNKEGFTPLHEALQSHNAEIVHIYFAQVCNAFNRKIVNKREDYKLAYCNLLTRPNKDGFTPLHDALKSNNLAIVRIYFAEVRYAREHGIISKRAYRVLLTRSNKDGFTPLHDALKSNNPAIVRIYFAEVCDVFNRKIISKREDYKLAYCNLLTKPNKDGFTPLQQAIVSNDEEIVCIYFDKIRNALKHGILDNDAFLDLLTKPNNAGFTPLYDAFKSGNPTIFRIYFDKVCDAFNDKLLSKPDVYVSAYCNFLTYPNKNGFTPLHNALIAGNAENIRAYLDEVRDALKHGIINKRAYRHLLTNPNNAGFTPLHEAFIAGNIEILHIYFAEVRCAIKNGTLDNNDYRHLLTKPNNAGFTPLHQAAKSGCLEAVKFFINNLQEALFVEEYRESLFILSARGYLPSCSSHNYDDALRINRLLNAERERLRGKMEVSENHHAFYKKRKKNLEDECFTKRPKLS